MKVKDFNVNDYSYSNRLFKLLFFQISHSEMIIRSSKHDALSGQYYNCNVDVYLGGVQYFDIPCRINGLSFKKPSSEDITYLSDKTDVSVSEENVIVIVSNGKTYYIVASVISVSENTLSEMELPIHSFLRSHKDD